MRCRHRNNPSHHKGLTKASKITKRVIDCQVANGWIKLKSRIFLIPRWTRVFWSSPRIYRLHRIHNLINKNTKDQLKCDWVSYSMSRKVLRDKLLQVHRNQVLHQNICLRQKIWNPVVHLDKCFCRQAAAAYFKCRQLWDTNHCKNDDEFNY